MVLFKKKLSSREFRKQNNVSNRSIKLPKIQNLVKLVAITNDETTFVSMI